MSSAHNQELLCRFSKAARQNERLEDGPGMCKGHPELRSSFIWLAGHLSPAWTIGSAVETLQRMWLVLMSCSSEGAPLSLICRLLVRSTSQHGLQARQAARASFMVGPAQCTSPRSSNGAS